MQHPSYAGFAGLLTGLFNPAPSSTSSSGRPYTRRMSEREIRDLNPLIHMRDVQLSRKGFNIIHGTRENPSKTYTSNGAREVARRLRQAEARA